MTHRKAYIYLLIAIAAISLSPILTRFATAPSLSISAFRLLFATGLTYLLGYKAINLGLKKLTRSSVIWIIISGVALALHFWAWIESLNFTSVASSTLLVSTHPLFVLPLCMFLFKEPLTTKKVAGLVLTLLGTLLLSGVGSLQDLTQDFYGNMLALVGALFVGIYLIIGKKIRHTTDNETYTFMIYAVATVFLWSTQPISGINILHFSGQDYLIFVLLAIFPTLLGHTIFNKVLETLSATTISLATLGEPILASVYAFILFKETLTGIQLVAGFLIITGIVVSEITMKHKEPS
jgi:drug/metabolite transporter (DMT)-like permease